MTVLKIEMRVKHKKFKKKEKTNCVKMYSRMETEKEEKRIQYTEKKKNTKNRKRIQKTEKEYKKIVKGTNKLKNYNLSGLLVAREC